jgi:hypothetical protein
MRNISITIPSPDKIEYIPNCMAGYVGEHNQTRLLIALPDSPVGYDYYKLLFSSNSVVKPVKKEPLYPVDGVITFDLTKDITDLGREIKWQLDGYNAVSGGITTIAKNEMTKLLLGRSITDDSVILPDEKTPLDNAIGQAVDATTNANQAAERIEVDINTLAIVETETKGARDETVAAKDETLAAKVIVLQKALEVIADRDATLAAKETAITKAAEALQSAADALAHKQAAETARDTAVQKALEALNSAAAALLSEQNSKTSEINAGQSETAAAQALADLLAMLGVDVATLVGGKIPMAQLPATATQEIYEVTAESELTGLTAQRGDLGEIIEIINGKKTVTKTYQLLGNGDATVLDNWVIWGTSYAVQAGNASTADNAENANMINNHRLVFFATEAEYQSAVKEGTTLYAFPAGG